MKKNLKRNKVLLTSLLGLAIVASATAAFSTWIFGVINKTADNDLTIYVDTTQSKSVVLTANATNKTLKVGEKDDVSGADNYVNVNKYENALLFTLNDFTITFSSATIKPKKINFELVANDINKVTLSATDYFNRTANDYSYIALAQESIDLSTNPDDKTCTVSPDGDGNGNTVWNIVDKEIEFKWGTFFTFATAEETAPTKPSQFYNNHIAKLTSDADKLTAIKKAQDEIDAMHKKLDGKSLTLKITVVTEDIKPGA